MQRYSISTLAKTNNSPLRLFREDIDLRQVPYFVINHHFARIHMDVPWEVTAHGAFLMTNCITILHFINTIVIIILLLQFYSRHAFYVNACIQTWNNLFLEIHHSTSHSHRICVGVWQQSIQNEMYSGISCIDFYYEK